MNWGREEIPVWSKGRLSCIPFECRGPHPTRGKGITREKNLSKGGAKGETLPLEGESSIGGKSIKERGCKESASGGSTGRDRIPKKPTSNQGKGAD